MPGPHLRPVGGRGVGVVGVEVGVDVVGEGGGVADDVDDGCDGAVGSDSGGFEHDVVQCVVEDRKVSQPQKVHLQEAGFFDGRAFPLSNDVRFSRDRLQRDIFRNGTIMPSKPLFLISKMLMEY